MNYSYPVQPAVLNDQLLDSLNVVLLLLDIHQNTTLGAEHHFEQNTTQIMQNTTLSRIPLRAEHHPKFEFSKSKGGGGS